MDSSGHINEAQNQPLIEEDGQNTTEGFNHPDSIFKEHPFENAGILSKFFFSWPYKVLQFGSKNQFKVENLGGIRDINSSQYQAKRFKESWQKYKNSKKMPIFKALARTHMKEFLFAFFINFIVVCMHISIPFLIIQIIEFMSTPSGEDGGIWIGIGLIAAYVIISWLAFLLDEHAVFLQALLGDNAYSGMISNIYEKILKITPSTNKDFRQGEIINFIQVDAEKAFDIAWCFPPVARLPIQLIFGIAFLLYYFGWFLLPSLGVAVLLVILNFYIAIWNSRIQDEVLERKDKRMNTTTEVVNNIKVIKLNSWGRFFIDKVARLRKREIHSVNKGLVVNTVEIITAFIMSPVFMVGTFFLFFVFGNTMILAHAFAARHVFYSLEEPIRWVPQFVGTFAEFLVSMRRIEKFLQCDEINPNIVEMNNEYCKEKEIDILIENANFTWAGSKVKEKEKDEDKKDTKEKKNKEEEKEDKKKDKASKKTYTINEEYQSLDMDDIEDGLNTSTNTTTSTSSDSKNKKLTDSIELKDINLKIHKGEFICIIGEVGSGKSSLLSAILGDMLYLSDETIEVNQDRILDEELRKELIRAALTEQSIVKLGGSISYAQQVPWIQNKTIRDNILFGKRMDEQRYNQVIEMCELGPDLGLFPGGDLTEIGEKGINLSGGQKARVSLARSIYADNDILLMDDPVSALDANVKRKFKDVFMNQLREKTRILVTHAIDFIDCVDRIIVMESGRIKYCGTYEELQHSEEIKHIVEVLAHQAGEDDSQEEKKEESKKETKETPQEKVEEKSFISEQGTRITDEENDEKIDVGWNVYKTFFLSDNFWVLYLMTFPLLAVYAYFIVNHTISFGHWIENSNDGIEYGRNFLIVVLYPFGYTLMISLVFLLITVSIVRSSRLLHEKMFKKTINAPINLYFDKTPSGRVLNRFSKDINKIDTTISHRLVWSTECYTSFLYNLVIAMIAMPWVGIIIPIILLICFFLVRFYMKTYRDIKRLTSVTHSPVIAQLSETLSGCSTIRNFGKEEQFINDNFKKINLNISSEFWLGAVRRWFTVRLELSCRVIIIAALCLMLYFKDDMNPILVGVFLNHMMWMNNEIIWGAQTMTEFESDLVSYQRCLKILEIPQENTQNVQKQLLLNDKSFEKLNVNTKWPNSGRIGFNNFSLKYRPTTPTVLKNLSFSINNGEKIGVVGRTGAGKSTLCLALCRIVEAYQGSITIDEQDISTVDLEQLRNKITIIPQDPTLFNGSLRFNLDPEGIHPDSTLLDLASQASLQKLVDRDDKGLDQNIEEGGANLSSGEKQLLCICRAILRKNRVVLMDEATANIDIKTEQTIQELINTQFRDSTVITIAHRLNTIMSSDRILVLSHGELVEYDSPGNLLKDPGSMFKSYVDSFKNK
ncbi:unnamed protein product [Moneuplotes crassus]|uniref:Uncharacterized protein n=1 Tax=Euplotes crassus TaxID=5936 RepID=A0AAD1X126_EUPCR|nr:unnamed protein product [Moneuplotes crassus]